MSVEFYLDHAAYLVFRKNVAAFAHAHSVNRDLLYGRGIGGLLINHGQRPAVELEAYRSLAFTVKLGRQELGLKDHVSVSALDAEHLGQYREHEPAGRAREIVINTASLGIEIFRNAGIYLTLCKIRCMTIKCSQYLPAVILKTPGIKGISEHDSHVGEYRAVFFLAVGETEHTAHVRLDLVEICIELVSADGSIVNVLIS